MGGMMKFEIAGYLKNLKRPFKKTVEAKSKNDAIEKILCLFGSNNGLKRTTIEIKEVKEIG
jgi:ribosomal protein L20A (L18A)